MNDDPQQAEKTAAAPDGDAPGTLGARLLRTAAEIRERIDACKTLALTRIALVEPIIGDVLGFDLRNPREVVPEESPTGYPYTDCTRYTLLHAGRPMLYIMAQAAGTTLPEPGDAGGNNDGLPTDALKAWTNGRWWRFTAAAPKGADTEEPLVVHEIDMMSVTLHDADCLHLFTRDALTKSDHRQTMYLVYAERKAAAWLAQELYEPSTELVELAASKCHAGRRTTAVIDTYRAVLPLAIRGVLERVRSTSVDAGPPPLPAADGRDRDERLVGLERGRVVKTGASAKVARWLLEKLVMYDDGARAINRIAGSGRHTMLQCTQQDLPESRHEYGSPVGSIERGAPAAWFCSGHGARRLSDMLRDVLRAVPANSPAAMAGLGVRLESKPVTADAKARNAAGDGERPEANEPPEAAADEAQADTGTGREPDSAQESGDTPAAAAASDGDIVNDTDTGDGNDEAEPRQVEIPVA